MNNRNVDFVTKKNLEYYHENTVKKIAGEVVTINGKLGNTNVPDAVASLRNDIENVKVKGLTYNSANNATTFESQGLGYGEVTVKDLYVIRDGNPVALSSLIGGISLYNNAGTVFNDKQVQIPNLKTDELFIKIKFGDYYKYLPLNYDTQRKLSLVNLYIVLGETDEDDCQVYISEQYDNSDFKDEKFYYRSELIQPRAGVTPNEQYLVYLHVYTHDVDMAKSLSDSDNQEKNILTTFAFFNTTTFKVHQDYQASRPPQVVGHPARMVYEIHGLIYTDTFIFNDVSFLAYKQDSEIIDNEQVDYPFEILYCKCKCSKSNYVVDALEIGNKRPVSSNAVASALNTTNTNITNTNNELTDAKKLLYRLTSRVDDLDLETYDGGDFRSLGMIGCLGEIPGFIGPNALVYSTMIPLELVELKNLVGIKNVQYVLKIPVQLSHPHNPIVQYDDLKIGLVIKISVYEVSPRTTTIQDYRYMTIVDKIQHEFLPDRVGGGESISIPAYDIVLSDNINDFLTPYINEMAIRKIEISIKKDIPEAPTNIKTVNITSIGFKIKWDIIDGLPNRRWQVQYKLNNLSWDMPVNYESVSVRSNSFDTHDGAALLSYKTYDIRIRTYDTFNQTYSGWVYHQIRTLEAPDVYIYIPSCYTPISMGNAVSTVSTKSNNLKNNPIIYKNAGFNDTDDTSMDFLNYEYNHSLHFYAPDNDGNPNSFWRIISTNSEITILLEPADPTDFCMSIKVASLLADSANNNTPLYDILDPDMVAGRTLDYDELSADPEYTDVLNQANTSNVVVLNLKMIDTNTKCSIQKFNWVEGTNNIDTLHPNEGGLFDGYEPSLFSVDPDPTATYYAIIIKNLNAKECNVLVGINGNISNDIVADDTGDSYNYRFNISTVGTNPENSYQWNQYDEQFKYGNDGLEKVTNLSRITDGSGDEFNVFCNKCLGHIDVSSFTVGNSSNTITFAYPINNAFYATPTNVKLSAIYFGRTYETYYTNNKTKFNLTEAVTLVQGENPSLYANFNNIVNDNLLSTNAGDKLLNIHVSYGSGYLANVYENIIQKFLDYYDSVGTSYSSFMTALHSTISGMFDDEPDLVLDIIKTMFPKTIRIRILNCQALLTIDLSVNYNNPEIFQLLYNYTESTRFYNTLNITQFVNDSLTNLVQNKPIFSKPNQSEFILIYSSLGEKPYIYPGDFNITFNLTRMWETINNVLQPVEGSVPSSSKNIEIDFIFEGDEHTDTIQTIVLDNVGG